MMRRLMLALLFVLLAATSATAEGAWVLWHKADRIDSRTGGYVEYPWDFHSAHRIYRDCESELDAKVKQMSQIFAEGSKSRVEVKSNIITQTWYDQDGRQM